MNEEDSLRRIIQKRIIRPIDYDIYRDWILLPLSDTKKAVGALSGKDVLPVEIVVDRIWERRPILYEERRLLWTLVKFVTKIGADKNRINRRPRKSKITIINHPPLAFYINGVIKIRHDIEDRRHESAHDFNYWSIDKAFHERCVDLMNSCCSAVFQFGSASDRIMVGRRSVGEDENCIFVVKCDRWMRHILKIESFYVRGWGMNSDLDIMHGSRKEVYRNIMKYMKEVKGIDFLDGKEPTEIYAP